MTKQTIVTVLAGAALATVAWGSQSVQAATQATMPRNAITLAADAKEPAVKTGAIGAVDAKKKTFELKREGVRPLTMTVNDKTVITLDGKDSTFDAAIKTDVKVTVTYAKVGDDRVASKVEVTMK